VSGWSQCVRVPQDEETIEKAVEGAAAHAHILLSPGVHVLSSTLVVDKCLQFIGAVGREGRPLSIIRHTTTVLRVEKKAPSSSTDRKGSTQESSSSGGGQGAVCVGLLGVGLWCHASDSGAVRRAAVSVEEGAALQLRHCNVKCVSGRYSSGVLVAVGGRAALHSTTVSGCSGSGVIVFGKALLRRCTVSDNAFNGVEVQKGAECAVEGCVVAGNGYGTNGSDLGSGVTVYGEGSLAWLKKSTVQSNKGGGVLVHSGSRGILQACEVSMNHSGYEFGDLDVDSGSEVVCDHCVFQGNGEHGQQQYRVVAVQAATLTLRYCDVSCGCLSFGTGVEVQNGGHVRLAHTAIHGCSGSGVLMRDLNTSATILRSRLFENALHGIEMQAGTVVVRESAVEHNRVHDLYASETNGACTLTIDHASSLSKPLFQKSKVREEEAGREEAGKLVAQDNDDLLLV